MFNLDKGFFGLDIGYNSLKIVESQGDKNGIKIRACREAKAPEGSLQANGIKDKDKLIKAIEEALKETLPRPVQGRKVVSALPDSLVFTKTIELPKMPAEEIAKAVPYEAGENFPLAPDDLYIDWQILTSIGDNNHNHNIHVLMIAAPKILVDNYLEVLKMVGLELIRLETKPIALARLINFGSKKEENYLIVDIGAEITGLSIYGTDSIRFTGAVAVGGEALKKDEKKIEGIIEGIEHLIKYYQTRMGQGRTDLEHIYLAGGGANMKGLGKNLQDKIGVKTKLIVPDKKIKFPKNITFSPQFSTALGLSLPE